MRCHVVLTICNKLIFTKFGVVRLLIKSLSGRGPWMGFGKLLGQQDNNEKLLSYFVLDQFDFKSVLTQLYCALTVNQKE